jgi:hypothetical protein
MEPLPCFRQNDPVQALLFDKLIWLIIILIQPSLQDIAKMKTHDLKIDALYSSRKNLPLTVRSLIDDLTEYFIKTA